MVFPNKKSVGLASNRLTNSIFPHQHKPPESSDDAAVVGCLVVGRIIPARSHHLKFFTVSEEEVRLVYAAPGLGFICYRCRQLRVLVRIKLLELSSGMIEAERHS